LVKCALIGGKGMGLKHGRNFHSHPDAEVIAVCDMDPQKLDLLEREFSAPGYPSIDELLANCSPDLVLLIVNETRRIPPLRQLFAAGQNVFTEKPLCGLEGQYRVREEDAVIAAPAIREWRSSGVKFGIDFNYRFMEHFRRLHEDVVQGTLGQIRMVRARAHFNCWSHVIDQILWTMGLPEWVSAIGDPKQPGPWPRMIHMRWSNGAIGSLDGTNLWSIPLEITILGDKGYAEARGLVGWYQRYKPGWGGGVEVSWEAKPEEPEMEKSFVRMADGVIKAMLDDEPMPADGNAAWNELLLEAAVHRSALNGGEWVKPAEVERDTMTASSS